MLRPLKILKQELGVVVNGLDGTRSAPPGKWSAAEIMEHLCLTYSGTAKAFEKAVAGEGVKLSAKTWKSRMATFLVVGLGYLPEGRKAPPHTVPRGESFEVVKDRLFSELDRMAAACDACKQRFGRRPVFDHPFIGPFNIDQWARFHLVHGRHHMKQLRRIGRD